MLGLCCKLHVQDVFLFPVIAFSICLTIKFRHEKVKPIYPKVIMDFNIRTRYFVLVLWLILLKQPLDRTLMYSIFQNYSQIFLTQQKVWLSWGIFFPKKYSHTRKISSRCYKQFLHYKMNTVKNTKLEYSTWSTWSKIIIWVKKWHTFGIAKKRTSLI